MFEAQVAYYLNKYLGTYLEGIDPASLKISIYKGDVVLRNLKLKADALSELGLPICIQAGLLGSLTLKVPWSALGQMPVEVRMDRLFLLARPQTESEKGVIRTPEDVESAFQSAKRQRVQQHETAWLAELERLQEAKRQASAKDGAQSSFWGGATLRGVIDTVIGNLQLSITNIHVRYEDELSHPGHPFSCGLTLERLAASTVDEKGREAFVTASPLSLLRKALDLRRAAVYFDTDTELWRPTDEWHEMDASTWDSWFLPGVVDQDIVGDDSTTANNVVSDLLTHGGTARHREYVLHPVGGRAFYSRVGRLQTTEESEPRVATALALDPVALRLSRSQYQSYQRLLAEVSGYAARRAFAAYRPGVRPAAGESAKAWWRYAVRATQQVRQERALSWSETVRFAMVRRRYVSLYAKHLRSKGARMLGLTDPERAELKACNDVLPEPTLLMFRRLAHAEVQRERRREARAAAAQQQQQKEASATGWVAWLTGRGGDERPASTSATTTDPTMRADFTPEEFAKLVDMVEDQEEGLVFGTSTPYTLLAQARMSISSASAELVDDGTENVEPVQILRGALDGIAADLKKYPQTTAVTLNVTGMGVHSPEGVLVRTGESQALEITEVVPPSPPSGINEEEVGETTEEKPEEEEAILSSADTGSNKRWLLAMPGFEQTSISSQENPALAVTFVQAPQDGSADADIAVILRPSFVYYSATTVEGVVNFFKTPEALDFSNLQIAASGQLDRARKAAAAYAAAAMQSRPKFNLRLQLDAPKIAVPVADQEGELSLVLDLGQFIVRSDREGATKCGLTPEEAALYEAIRLDGSDVQAFLVQGRYDWDERVSLGGEAKSTLSFSSSSNRTAIPLLERCGLSISVQVSLFPDPDRPALRLQPVIPSLHFHLSPGRVRWLMRILDKAVPTTQSGQESSQPLGEASLASLGPRGVDSGTECTKTGALRLLRWTGIGRTTETWQPVYAVVTRKGKLYIYSEAPGPGSKIPSTTPIATQSLWVDRRISPLDPEDVHGISHVLAITPIDLEAKDVLESSSAVLLRFETEDDALSWLRALCEAQQGLRDLAGTAPVVPAPEWDETSSVMSSEDASASSVSIRDTLAEQQAYSKQQFAAPTTLVQVDAELGELALYVAGRTPVVWWPLEQEDSAVEKAQEAFAKKGFPAFIPDGVANIAGEQQIIVVRATGGSCGFTYGVPGLRTHTVLEALEVEDLLVGPKNPRQRFLASSAPRSGLKTGQDDLFFDAAEDNNDDAVSLGSARSSSLELGSRGDLAEFSFAIARPGTAGYEGVDTSLAINLGTLYFYANRPTLAALMSAGTDFAAAAARPSSSSSESTQQGGGDGLDHDQTMEEDTVEEKPVELGQASGEAVVQAADQALASQLEQKTDLAAPLEPVPAAGTTPSSRTMFRMRVTLGTLALALNYEGAGDDVLSRASVENFSFGLDILPTGMLELSSELGNIQLLDETLPANHPYHVACGLRGDRTSSLIDLKLFMYPPGVLDDPRVPPGLSWAYLRARLSQLQLVALYRLLAEHLTYLNVMLAMRLDQGGGVVVENADQLAQTGGNLTPRTTSAALQPQPQQAPSVAQIPEEAAQQPFVLVLDVEMDAPVIVLPRNSNSLDSLEVDLGALSLKSKVIGGELSQQGAQTSTSSKTLPLAFSGAVGGVPLLTELASLSLSGMSCAVVQGGKCGQNIFRKQSDQGWRVDWRRPLQPERRGLRPMFDVSLDIPLMSAIVSNAEYTRITSIAAANFAEKPCPPDGVQWLTLHYEAVTNAGQAAGAQPPEPESTPNRSPSQVVRLSSGTKQIDKEAEKRSPLQVRVSLTLRRAELELQQLLEGVSEPQPLARFSIEGLWVSFYNTEAGSMSVSLCLPRVEGIDLRPEVPLTHNRVISSANKASFLMLEWSASPGMATMKVGLTLQKPLFVAELSFLLALTRYILPGLTLGGSHPIPFASQDILLPAGGVYSARETGDHWLTPVTRLLADAPGGSREFVFDGAGHRLILPPQAPLNAAAPLILIGTGCTLTLRNVKVVHSDVLSSALQLAPGARLVAEPGDGVTFVPGGPAAQTELAHALLPAPLRDAPKTATGVALGAELERQARTTPRHIESGSLATPQPTNVSEEKQMSIDISVCAVGIGLELAKLDPRTGSVHLLAATMDLGAGMLLEGAAKSGQVRLQGLQIESRYLASDGTMDNGDDDDGHGPQHSPGSKASSVALSTAKKKKRRKGNVDTLVLDPCQVKLDFDLRLEGEDGSPPVLTTDVRLGVSDVMLNLSPDVLELASSMITATLEPLSAPPAFEPLWSCSKFEKVWSYTTNSDDNNSPEDEVLLPSTSLTAWRPRPRPSYLPLGDVLAPESEKPVFEVLAVSAGSGIAAYPLRWEAVWSGAGATVWRGVAPRGYAMLGDVVTANPAGPPRVTDYACVNTAALISVPRGQCLRLPPRLPHAPAAAAALRASVAAVRLWCCDNSVGTFFAEAVISRKRSAAQKEDSSSKASQKQQHEQLDILPGSLDFRTPLGVHSAGLIAMGAATFVADETSGALSASREWEAALPGKVVPVLDARAQYQRYLEERHRSAKEDVRRVLTPAVVDFHRLWTDQGASTGGQGVSFWRPVAPPGYASLGDCLVRGLDPPDQALVVRDLGLGASHAMAMSPSLTSTGARARALAAASAGRGRPLLWKPRGYELVWQDTSVREDLRLTIWRPVPYPGYVTVGYLAARGMRAPPEGSVMCLRDDAAVKSSLGRTPAWSVRADEDGPPQLSAWTTDDSTHAFVTINSALGRPGEVYSLRPVYEEAGDEGGTSSSKTKKSETRTGSVNVVARMGRTCLLLRDAFRVPLLELDLGAVDAGVQGPSQTVVQAYAGFSLSLWSYNGSLRAWEPVIEPWQGIALCDANFGAVEADGIQPGMHVSLKASSETVVGTLSYGAAASLLSALHDWNDLRSDDEEEEAVERLRGVDGAGGAAAQHVLVENTLGISAAMELDFGNRLEMVVLPSGKATRVLRPLPSFAARDWKQPPPETLPYDLLLLDVLGFESGASSSSGSLSKETMAARKLYIVAICQDLSPEETLDPGAGVHTCAVEPTSVADKDCWQVDWNERLVLALPLWAQKRPMNIKIELRDAAAVTDEDASFGAASFTLPLLAEVPERKAVQVNGDIPGLGSVHVAWQLQTSRGRKALKERASSTQETAGDRALSIASQEGIWSVIPKISGLGGREESGKKSGATLVQLGAETVVIEGSVRGGARCEMLRALCVVQNSTALELEVALGRVEDAEWAEIPSRAGTVSAERSANTVVEEVFEHERWAARVGWSGTNLVQGQDPPRFLFGVHGSDGFPSPDPPKGWDWDSGWMLDRGLGGDKEGWAYASDFGALHFPPPAGAYKPSSQDTVRARRWVRRRVRLGTSTGFGLAPAHSITRQASVSHSEDDGAPKIVGCVEPGGTLPLPLGWDRGGTQLLIRPVEEDSDGGHSPSHDWSKGGSEGDQTLLLDCLKESMTRLVYCKALANEGSSTGSSTKKQEEEAAEQSLERSVPAWFAWTLESDILSTGPGLLGTEPSAPVMDWRIIISPPLTVANQLPLAGSLLVWEEDRAQGQLRSRQTLRVRSGQSTAFHSADMRRAISFSFYPDGYDWMEVAPAIISAGFKSSGKPQPTELPERVKIGRPGATRGIDVFVRRQLELGPWLLHSKEEEMDPSVAASKGVPLTVTLMVPLWVINSTSLMVDVAVASVTPSSAAGTPSSSFSLPQRSSSSRSAGGSLAGTGRLRTLTTDASQVASGDPPSLRHVPPGSTELLSYPALATSGRRQSYGVRVRVAGSGWTPSLALESVALGNTSAGTTDVDSLQPVLVRARVRASGRTHEVVARLEVGPSRACQVLYLEPYLVVSNRTPVAVTLMHSLALSLLAVQGHPSEGGVLTPAGAKVVSPTPLPGGGGGVPEHAGQGPQLLRYDETGTYVEARSNIGTYIDAPEGLLSTGSLVSMPPSHYAGLTLNPGATNVPIDLPLGAEKHVICCRCNDAGDDDDGMLLQPAGLSDLWSRPLVISNGKESTEVLVAPLLLPELGRELAHTSDASALLLRVMIVRRGAGTLQMIVESANADPPYCLENRTAVPLLYRQAYLPDTAPWHSLPPYSAAGWAWEHTMAGLPMELEMREALSEPQVYNLEADFAATQQEQGSGASSSSTEPRLLALSVAPHACSVSIGWMEQVASNVTGIARIGGDGAGGALGRGGVDRLLVLTPGTRGGASHDAIALTSDVLPREVTVRFESIELSLMDAAPQEIALLTLMDVKVQLRTGPTPSGTYRSASLTLGRVQVDDELPGTRFPVVLAPAKGQPSDLAVLQATVTQQVGVGRGRTFFPIVALHLPVTMQLALGEPLIWRVNEMITMLQSAGGGKDDGAIASSSNQQLATADPHLHIRLLTVSDLRAQISFGADPLSRPRQVSGGAISVVLDLATFQAAPIELRGFELADLSILQSAFVQQVMQIVQGQLFSVGLSLVRNFGVIGGASKVLGLLSASVAKLATPTRAEGGAASAPSASSSTVQSDTKQISGMGDGLAEGFGAFGTGIMRGLKGVLQKPTEGARQQGIGGAVRGLGRGLLGVVADPLSGALDALSATAQGMDVSLSKSRERLLELQRRRLPRVISVDGRIMPLLKDNSANESRLESLGQALLHSTLIGAGRSPNALGERYEQHFVLPDSRVVVLTDRAFFLLYAPGFDTLCAAADLGAIAVSEVGAGEIKWRVGWDDVLCLELRMSRECPDAEPDRLIVHRKGKPGRQQEESLAHQVKCFPNTPQACQIKVVAQLILKRRYLDPIRSNDLWSARHSFSQGGSPSSSKDRGPSVLPSDLPPASALPIQLPCLEFARMWHSNPQRSPVISFWRPLPPAGYRPAADVVVRGLEPPALPVHCFRDDTAFLEARGPEGLGLTQNKAGQERAVMSSLATARPREFSLLWRSNARRPITIWLPVAPPGYVALGTVVLGAAEQPRMEDYVCLREDLTAPGRCAESPLWRYDPVAAAAEAALAAGQVPRGPGGGSFSTASQSHHPETWRVSVWPVLGPSSSKEAMTSSSSQVIESGDGKTGARNFMAVRAFSKPADEWLRVFDPESSAAQGLQFHKS